MRLYIASLIALLLLVLPASATDTTIEGVSSQYLDAAEGNVFSYIQLHNVDPASVTSLYLDTDTYTFDADITYLNWYSSQVQTSFFSKIENTTYSFSDTWYHLPVDDLSFQFGSKDDFLEGLAAGGPNIPLTMYNATVYPPQYFDFSSDAAIDVTYHEVEFDSAAFTLTDAIKNIIEKVPIVGPHVVLALSLTGSIAATFYTYAVFTIENWAILLMTFETFVLFRAVIIMQGRGKQSKKISKALTSIVSDNKAMLEFMINVFTKIIELVYSAIKAIGAWIPFT
ncbi:hypothetical protein V7O66_03420 [Methanolobus sp. ZRKC3]|uniref:hypothetical protein n=1 Tax=Methanolobus sp. ZRKC3 TaxID=3125786 RepID=UPI0032532554